MKNFIIVFCIFIFSGCGYKDYPFSETTYNGVYNIDKGDAEDIKGKFFEVCKILQCRIFDNSSRNKGDSGFMMIVKVNKNEELTLFKDTRDIVFFMITQKKKGKFNPFTLDVLKEFKKNGVEFKLIHLEEWICNGEELSYENCTRKETEYNNLDYIEFVKSNLDKA